MGTILVPRARGTPCLKQNKIGGRIAYGADNLVFVLLFTTLPNFKRADNDENCLEQTIKVKSTLSEQWENAEAAHRKRIQTDNEVQAQRRVQYLDSFGLHFKSQNTILRRLRAILCHPRTILGPSWTILGRRLVLVGLCLTVFRLLGQLRTPSFRQTWFYTKFGERPPVRRRRSRFGRSPALAWAPCQDSFV